MNWSWGADFIANLVTLASLGGAFAVFSHIIYFRNRHGRMDRLVWGLLGLFNAMVLLTLINLAAILGFIPDHDWIRWPVRIVATVCALNGAWAAKHAEPLVYLSDLRLLNQRVLNKRAVITQQDHEIAVLRRKVEKYERVFGPLPD